MLFPILLNAESVRDHFTQLQAQRPQLDTETIPLVSYPSPPPRKTSVVILRPQADLKPVQPDIMPFPVPRDDDSDFDDSAVEMVDQAAISDDETKTQSAKAPKPPKPEVVFERISPADYKKNETAIKEGLRSNDAEIYTKFPAGKPVPAERFPSATSFSVFTLPAYSGSVEFVYRPDDFPGAFVSFQDRQGERWKCVALWDDEKKKILYIANIQAEIRLCSELYTGSSKGKVRWEKAVEPRNNIPSNFGSFAVSDRVLLERRKAHWPEALKKLRDSCQGQIATAVKTEYIKMDEDDKPKKEPKEKKEPKQPKQPKQPKEPKEPKQPKEPKEPKQPKQPKEPKEKTVKKTSDIDGENSSAEKKPAKKAAKVAKADNAEKTDSDGEQMDTSTAEPKAPKKRASPVKKVKAINDTEAGDGVKSEAKSDVKSDAKTDSKPAPSRKRKADTYLQVTLTGKSKLVYTAGSGDHLVVEEITMAEGEPLSRSIFSA